MTFNSLSLSRFPCDRAAVSRKGAAVRRLPAKEGFTLVELSIVLVIIGLLIGGILVAQSMVSTTKVQSFIRQITQFDTAIANFQTKYNGLPGDTAAMGCTVVTANICGNGYIEDDNSVDGVQFYGYPTLYAGENANFWLHLQQSGFTNPGGGTFANTITGNFKVKGSAPNSPLLPLGNNTGVVPHFIGPLFSGLGYTMAPGNYYMIADHSLATDSAQIYDAGYFKESISPVDALAIDTKIDNGQADGDFLGTSNVYEMGAQFIAAGCSDGADAYNVSDSTAKCALLIKMLSTNGMAE